MESMKENVLQKRLQIPSDLGLVQKASSEVLTFLKPLQLSENDLFDVRLCLEEALINGMKYGHKLKKELSVSLFVEASSSKLTLTVEDQGPGFNYKALEDCTEENNLLKNSGRGVYLIRRLMDEVNYNAKGNSVQMVKYLK